MRYLKAAFALVLTAPTAAIARRRGGGPSPLDSFDSYIFIAFGVVIGLIIVWRIVDAIRGPAKSRSRRIETARQRRPDRPT